MTMSIGKFARAFLWAGALVVASQAHAQATRTWVSGVGDDVNPCSRTAPCRTFAGAISKTQDGGEIDVLDPANYGTVTITKSMTIASDGAGTAAIQASSTNGINVNAPANATIYLRKLIIDGGPPSFAGLNGVNIISGDVHIDDCVIHGFTGSPGAGISVSATVNPSRVFVTHTKIYGNNIGVSNTATVSSPIALVDTVIDKNLNFGIQGTTATASFSLRHSEVTGTVSGVSAPPPSAVSSFGDNIISGVVAGTTITPVALR